MELSELIQRCAAEPDGAALHKLLTDLQNLDSKRSRNLYQLAALAEQIERKVSGTGSQMAQEVLEWLAPYHRELSAAQDDHRRQFGLELEKGMQAMGLELKGHYPTLHAGLFQFKLNFDKGQCRIWYGPEQEALADPRLDATEVATTVKKLREKLGSTIDVSLLLDKIRVAYRHARLETPSGPIALTTMLPYVALAVQSGKFRADPRKGYRGYGRADFSYDLFRLQGKIHLVTATRQQTQKRGDFLWVPTREDIESGGYFASMKLEEE